MPSNVRTTAWFVSSGLTQVPASEPEVLVGWYLSRIRWKISLPIAWRAAVPVMLLAPLHLRSRRNHKSGQMPRWLVSQQHILTLVALWCLNCAGRWYQFHRKVGTLITFCCEEGPLSVADMRRVAAVSISEVGKSTNHLEEKLWLCYSCWLMQYAWELPSKSTGLWASTFLTADLIVDSQSAWIQARLSEEASSWTCCLPDLSSCFDHARVSQPS